MIAARFVLWIAYEIIYLWIVVFCGWNVFLQKNTYRAIGAAMIMVPFLLRMLKLK